MRELKVFLLNLIPDRLVNAPGIAFARREEVDDQQMNALHDQIGRLLDKRSQLALTCLVARRDDLNHGDDLAIAMSDADPIGFACVDPVFGVSNELRARGYGGYGKPGARLFRFLVFGRQPQGENVGIGPRIDCSGSEK